MDISPPNIGQWKQLFPLAFWECTNPDDLHPLSHASVPTVKEHQLAAAHGAGGVYSVVAVGGTSRLAPPSRPASPLKAARGKLEMSRGKSEVVLY